MPLPSVSNLSNNICQLPRILLRTFQARQILGKASCICKTTSLSAETGKASAASLASSSKSGRTLISLPNDSPRIFFE